MIFLMGNQVQFSCGLLKKGKHQHSVYYNFNGEDHDMDEQSGDEDDPNDELDDIGMNTFHLLFYIMYYTCIIYGNNIK